MRDNRGFVVMTSAALAVLASPLQEAPGFPKCLEEGEGRERKAGQDSRLHLEQLCPDRRIFSWAA